MKFIIGWLLGLCMCTAFAQGGGAAVAPFDIHWETERTEPGPQGRGWRTEARFVVQARSAQLLGAGGWSLYFTCLAEADEGPMRGPFVVERLVGTLYRIRPTAAFIGMQAGQPLSLPLQHNGRMLFPDRAPQGPYLVFDSEPERALAPQAYRVLPPAGPLPGPTAEEHFARHAVVKPVPVAELPPVFPTPQALQRAAGALRWTALPRTVPGPGLAREAALARELLQPFFAAGRAAQEPPLRLVLGPVVGLNSPEAYELRIDPAQGVLIRGRTAAGVSRGLQSLRALMPLKLAEGATLPALTLRDAPQFEHRGLLLDVARHFHPKATVLRVVDLMARFKLNKLHLHLTDDEGWRIAIPGLPELTDFGARRGHSADPWRHLPPAHGSGPDAATSSGSGHFTEADYAEILRHAAARHVEVIPEIEMPGHARAAVQAMNARARRLSAAGLPGAKDFLLADPADRSRYSSAQRYEDHLMDPGLPSTYRFIEHVVAAITAMHRRAGVPLKQLHVGADELPNGAWAGSPASLAMIEREKLAGLPGLWNRFYDRVGEILRRHGLAAGGWEELGSRRDKLEGVDKGFGSGPLVPNEHFLGRGHTLYVWNNLDEADDLGYRLANAGYRVVLAPATKLYFDMAANTNPGEAGVNWAAMIELRDVFEHRPLDALRSPSGVALTPAGRARVAGVEGTLFAEIMPTRERLEHLMLPRLFALAERAWAAEPTGPRGDDAAWSRFAHQVGRQLLPALQRDLPDVAFRIPPPGLRRVGDAAEVNTAWPGLVVRFTTDGSEPTAQSPAVAGSRIETRALIRAAAFDPQGRRSLVFDLDLR